MKKKATTFAAPQAVADWTSQVVDEVFEEKKVKITDPKNIDVETMCPSFPDQVPVFIEISKGSHNKYEWDVKHNIMVLDRVLSSAVFYPYDYGFIPQTLCEDGDPLDCLVIGSNPALAGCVVHARPLGFLDFQDVDKSTGTEILVADQKVLAVLANDRAFSNWKTLADVPESTLDMIKEFFASYKNLEKKTKMRPSVDKGWRSVSEAKKLIGDCHTAFTKTIEAGLAQKLVSKL